MNKKDKEKIFFKNVTGYAFLGMIAPILFVVNPLIVIIPAVLYGLWRLIKKLWESWKMKDIDVDW